MSLVVLEYIPPGKSDSLNSRLLNMAAICKKVFWSSVVERYAINSRLGGMIQDQRIGFVEANLFGTLTVMPSLLYPLVEVYCDTSKSYPLQYMESMEKANEIRCTIISDAIEKQNNIETNSSIQLFFRISNPTRSLIYSEQHRLCQCASHWR